MTSTTTSTEGLGSDVRCKECFAQFVPGLDRAFHKNELHCELVREAVKKVVLRKGILRAQKMERSLPPPLREVPLSNGGVAVHFHDILLGETDALRVPTPNDERLAKFLQLCKDDPDFAARVAAS